MKMLSKKVSLADRNDVVVPEKHIFVRGLPNSGTYYTAISKLSIQKFAPDFRSESYCPALE